MPQPCPFELPLRLALYDPHVVEDNSGLFEFECDTVDQAAYAVKAVNFHGRLVESVREAHSENSPYHSMFYRGCETCTLLADLEKED